MTTCDLTQLDAEQLRDLVVRRDREIAAMKLFVEKLTHEMAVLKRLRFAASSEAYTPEQRSLLDDVIDADTAAIEAELDQIRGEPPASDCRQPPSRQPLPAHLPRR